MRVVVLIASLTLVLPLVAASLAVADEVHLQNGDRITGTVVRLAGGTLTFRTGSGELAIPWNTITSIASTQTLRATINTRPGTQTVTAFATSAPGRLELTPGGAIASADLVGLGPIERAFTIAGGGNAGFINSAGNSDVNSLRLDVDLQVRYRADRYTAATAINRARDRGVDSARNWTSSINYDRFVTRRFFLNANTIFTNDEFRDLDLRTAAGLGLGFQVYDTPRLKLTANAGLGWVNEDFIVAPRNDYSAARESAAFDFFAVPNRLQFFHKHDGYFGLGNDDDLFVKTHNGIRLTVVRNFVTTIQLDVDYTASPAPGLRQTDRTFALTFGYRF